MHKNNFYQQRYNNNIHIT